MAALGLVAYLALDGVASGLALFVAGLVLVAVGVWGWQGQGEPSRTAVAAGVDTPAEPAGPMLATTTIRREAEPEAKPVAPRRPRKAATEPAAPAEDGPGHSHDRPIVAHGDLVAHVRESHGGLGHDGSTQQLRRLHDRAHAASS